MYQSVAARNATLAVCVILFGGMLPNLTSMSIKYNNRLSLVLT